MLVHRIFLHNPLRNFNYMLVSEKTGQALCLDPLDANVIYDEARKQGWDITSIFNTHEHHDHVGGNLALKELTGAKVYASAGLFEKIPGAEQRIETGDTLDLGSDLSFSVIATPGHTGSHVSLYSECAGPCLFCGDTIFHAGVGNCYRGGDPHQLYKTISDVLSTLPGETKVYPGHEYLENNLKFTLHQNPGNKTTSAAQRLLKKVRDSSDYSLNYSASLRQEMEYNLFFQASASDSENGQDLFLKLRQLRDKW